MSQKIIYRDPHQSGDAADEAEVARIVENAGGSMGVSLPTISAHGAQVPDETSEQVRQRLSAIGAQMEDDDKPVFRPAR